MDSVYKFGPDACGEVVIREGIMCVIINDDYNGPHNYVIAPQLNADGSMSLRVDSTTEFVYDHIELIGDGE